MDTSDDRAASASLEGLSVDAGRLARSTPGQPEVDDNTEDCDQAWTSDKNGLSFERSSPGWRAPPSS